MIIPPGRETDAEARLSEMRTSELRTFSTGATRSPLGNKLQYEGYLNPLVLKRFAEYMKKHQIQSDGQHRAPDNWQLGIEKDSLIDSAYRHFQDWHLHHRGYGNEATEDLQESLCALIFGAMAYLKADMEESGRGMAGREGR